VVVVCGVAVCDLDHADRLVDSGAVDDKYSRKSLAKGSWGVYNIGVM